LFRHRFSCGCPVTFNSGQVPLKKGNPRPAKNKGLEK